MIASNYRQHPEALALQLPLRFGHALRWALPRPGARVLRAIRAERAATFKAAGRVKYQDKPVTPQWFRNARKAARELARRVKTACMELVERDEVTYTPDAALAGFRAQMLLPVVARLSPAISPGPMPSD